MTASLKAMEYVDVLITKLHLINLCLYGVVGLVMLWIIFQTIRTLLLLLLLLI